MTNASAISKVVIQILIMPFPWVIRKYVLRLFLPIHFGVNSKIGFSIILAHKAILKENASVGNFTYVGAIDYFEMGSYAKIGRRNWITGSSAKRKLGYVASPNRLCQFIIGDHTRITVNHHFDCSGGIYIGDFTTIAGTDTQILTHGIDLVESAQKAGPVRVGDYCFVGTKCLILKETQLPSRCLLAGGSVLTKKYKESEFVYGGVPARPLKALPANAKYFVRNHGNVT